MSHERYSPDEGRVQPVIVLRENEDGSFSARDVVGEATGSVQDVNIVSSDIPLGGGTGGVSSSVSIQDGVNPLNKLAVDASGRIGINNLPATQAVSGSVAVTNLPVTQPVSGTVTVSNPTANPETGLAKNATLTDGSQKTQVTNFPASQPVTGPLTDTQLRASAVPVSGSVAVNNWPSTQPVSGTVAVSGTVNTGLSQPLTNTELRAAAVSVSGPLTDAQLRAAALPVSLASVPSHAVTGPLTNTELRATPVPITGTVALGSGVAALYKGRASTLVTPGRAATTQVIFTIWNGSTRVIDLNLVGVDVYSTAAKAITVPPPVIRFYRVTAAPINGTLLTKVAEDSALTSDANIALRGDASADRTLAASALAATVSGGALNQEYGPRMITGAGYEMFDKSLFFETSPLVLRQNEGMAVRLEGPAATSIPATDLYIVNAIWVER